MKLYKNRLISIQQCLIIAKIASHGRLHINTDNTVGCNEHGTALYGDVKECGAPLGDNGYRKFVPTFHNMHS